MLYLCLCCTDWLISKAAGVTTIRFHSSPAFPKFVSADGLFLGIFLIAHFEHLTRFRLMDEYLVASARVFSWCFLCLCVLVCVTYFWSCQNKAAVVRGKWMTFMAVLVAVGVCKIQHTQIWQRCYILCASVWVNNFFSVACASQRKCSCWILSTLFAMFVHEVSSVYA